MRKLCQSINRWAILTFVTTTPDGDPMLPEQAANNDPDYPKFHLAPLRGRLNDPNGLVVRDGVHHAFFQYGPGFPQNRLVYWGHASSTDLITWRHHPPAITPDSWYDRSGAYSGGALLHDDEVWFYYTGNVKTDAGERESYQCLVTTADFERFTKDPDNPLISGPPPGYTAHFRDPQVTAEADGWRMLVGAQRDDLSGCILIYRSDDLRTWRLDGELGLPDAAGRFDQFGFMWECPNLLRVPDEVSGEYWDVLIFCPQGVGPIGEQFQNIFPCGYLVGKWDGYALRQTGEFLELDRGFEFYAPQAFVRDEADQAPVLLGWLGNASEDNQPSLTDHGWVHMLSVPRVLSVRNGRLIQRIAPVELNPRSARSAQTLGVEGMNLHDDVVVLEELRNERSFVLDVEIGQLAASSWELCLQSGTSKVVFAFERGGRLTIDRGATRYPHGSTRTVSVPDVEALRVQLVHDRSVTELFVADGHTVFSLRSYLEPGEFTVTLAARGSIHVDRAEAVVVDGPAGAAEASA